MTKVATPYEQKDFSRKKYMLMLCKTQQLSIRMLFSHPQRIDKISLADHSNVSLVFSSTRPDIYSKQNLQSDISRKANFRFEKKILHHFLLKYFMNKFH